MTHNPSSNRLFRLIFSLTFVSFVLVLTPRTDVVISQNLPEDSRIFGGPERKLYNGVPSKVPLKFKIRNVTSEKWVRDLEVEITNTSDKPIYYMHMYVMVPGAKDPGTGHQIGFLLKFGRIQLIDFNEPIRADDVPIKPGESHTFKISEGDASGWENLQRKNGKAEPKAVELVFQLINYGDGTGFRNTSASPVNIHRKVGLDADRIRPPNLGRPSALRDSFLPAGFDFPA